MKLKFIFISMFMLLSFLFLQNVNASLCIPYLEDAPIVDGYISVHDENGNYLGQLSELNNTIRDDWYLAINMQPTEDDEDNILYERVHILSDAKYSNSWDYEQVSYSNLFNSFGTVTPSSETFDFHEYLTGNSINGGLGQYFTEHGQFYSGSDYTFALRNLDSGFYEILLRATDECGLSGYKFIDLTVIPKPQINSYTCTGSLTVNTDNSDIFITDTCSDITLQSSANNINFHYTGTMYSDTNEKVVNLNLQGSAQKYINIFTNQITYNVFDIVSMASLFYCNFNNFTIIDNLKSPLFLYNFNGIHKLNTNSSYKYYYIDGTNNMIIEQVIPNPSTYIYSDIGSNKDTIGGNYLFRLVSFINYEFYFFGNDFSKNHIKIEDKSLENIIWNFDLYYHKDISYNYFENINHLEIWTLDYVMTEMYGNIFKFGSFPEIGVNIGLSEVYLGKEINGKYLGNAWLDENGNDVYSCPGNVIDVIDNNKIYKVCDTPVLIASFGPHYLYDYIIVTDENAGGSKPENLPKKPVGIINLNNYDPVINEQVTWDINDSYDPDGNIVNTKLYIDNVLYENVQTSTFTSDTPKTVSLRLEVTDNQGLTDTTYTTINFNDLPNQCNGNTPPYAEIKKTYLSDNIWKFETINDYDADGDTIVSKIWRINYNDIKSDVVTTTINYNQTVYLYLFDGCDTETYYTTVTSDLNTVPNEITEPEVNLACTLSSQSPSSNLNCYLNYNTLGYDLKYIKWYYDGTEITTNLNKTSFYSIISDTNPHTISVTVNNNVNSKSEFYSFQLVNNPIYINDTYTPPDNTDNGQTSNVYGGSKPIISSDIDQTTDNIVEYIGDLSNGALNIIIPVGLFLFVFLMIGGALAIIR